MHALVWLVVVARLRAAARGLLDPALSETEGDGDPTAGDGDPGDGGPGLETASIAGVRDWIAAGALDD